MRGYDYAADGHYRDMPPKLFGSHGANSSVKGLRLGHPLEPVKTEALNIIRALLVGHDLDDLLDLSGILNGLKCNLANLTETPKLAKRIPMNGLAFPL
jgi:hypothetical protein